MGWITCPKCGREEAANVDQEHIVSCGYCTMQEALAAERHGLVPKEPKPKIRISLRRRVPEVDHAFRFKKEEVAA